MTLAVKQQNLDTLTGTLLRVSDPKHPDYGRYLTKDQVDSLVAPSEKTVRTRDAGLRSLTLSFTHEQLTDTHSLTFFLVLFPFFTSSNLFYFSTRYGKVDNVCMCRVLNQM